MKSVTSNSTTHGDMGMDIVRDRRGLRSRHLVLYGTIAAVAVLAIGSLYFITHARRALVVVDRSTIVTDTVQRGTLVSSVDAAGTLQPESVRIVSGTQSGTANIIYVRAGAAVEANTPIAQLQNPDLDVAEVDAQEALTDAQATLESVRQQAIASRLTQESTVAGDRSQLQLAQINLGAETSLYSRGLTASSEYRTAQINAAQAQYSLTTARAQAKVDLSNESAKIAAAESDVEKAQAELAAKRAEVSALTILAGGSGIVQSVDAQPGQMVAAGTEIAKIADQRTLKAVLSVPESQVHQVLLGMPATTDTGNGTVTGHVSHIAPSASGGSVDVDVTFTHPLPAGARPDLNVDGSIILAKLPNVLSIARPANANNNAEMDLFKLVDGGANAVRVRVQFGYGSSSRITVLSGLKPGDTVITSDMSSYASQTEIHLQ